MCGDNREQGRIYKAQADFYDTMTAQYKEVFGKQQAILDDLTAKFKPIVDAGPNQRGFSKEEHTLLDTGATEGVANNFASVKKSLGEELAARGGSDFIPSGADTQLSAGIDAVAAAERSNLQNKIEMADFAAGKENWNTAINVLSGTAGMLNPVGYSEAATGAGNSAANTANEMAKADNSMWGGVMGMIGGVAGAAVGGWAGKQKKQGGGE